MGKNRLDDRVGGPYRGHHYPNLHEHIGEILDGKSHHYHHRKQGRDDVGTKMCGPKVIGKLVAASRKTPTHPPLSYQYDDIGVGKGRYSSMISNHSSSIFSPSSSQSSTTMGSRSTDSRSVAESAVSSTKSKKKKNNINQNRKTAAANNDVEQSHDFEQGILSSTSNSVASLEMQEYKQGLTRMGSYDSSSTTASELSLPKVIMQFDPLNQNHYSTSGLEVVDNSIATPRIRNSNRKNKDAAVIQASSEAVVCLEDVTEQDAEFVQQPRFEQQLIQPNEQQQKYSEEVQEELSPQEQQPLVPQEENANTITPLTSFFNSLRSPPWTLTLPAVMEESTTFESEEGIGGGVKSPVSILSRTSNTVENDYARIEILAAMKELVTKQQEIIKDLTDKNMQHEQRALNYKLDFKKMKEEKKEIQQSMIELLVHQQEYEGEAEYLRAEIRELRNAVREMNSSNDAEKNQKFEGLMSDATERSSDADSNNSFHRKILSPSNRSNPSSEATSTRRKKGIGKKTTIVPSSPSCTIRIELSPTNTNSPNDENFDQKWNEIAGLRVLSKKILGLDEMDETMTSSKSTATTATTTTMTSTRSGTSSSVNNYHPTTDNGMVTDVFIPDLGQEVMFCSQSKSMEIDTSSQCSDGHRSNRPDICVENNILYETEEEILDPRLQTHRGGGGGGSGSVSSSICSMSEISIRSPDSKATANEVAMFKSRLGSLQRKRLTRQQQHSNKHKKEGKSSSSRKVPVVRFSEF
jgi:hypothetical protein